MVRMMNKICTGGYVWLNFLSQSTFNDSIIFKTHSPATLMPSCDAFGSRIKAACLRKFLFIDFVLPHPNSVFINNIFSHIQATMTVLCAVMFHSLGHVDTLWGKITTAVAGELQCPLTTDQHQQLHWTLEIYHVAVVEKANMYVYVCPIFQGMHCSNDPPSRSDMQLLKAYFKLDTSTANLNERVSKVTFSP
jgi:hypothetical protein